MSQPYPVVMLMVQRSTVGKAMSVALLVLLMLSALPISSLALEVSDEMELDTNDSDIIQRVDGDGDGNFHVLFYSDEPGGDYMDLMYRKVGPSGNVIVDSIKVTPSNMDTSGGNTAIAVDGSGRAHVAMIIRTDSIDNYGVFYAQVGADGKLSIPAKKVYEDSEATRPISIDIETDSIGNAYIVWQQSTDPPVIMWAKMSPAGAVTKAAKEISGDLQFGGTVAYPRLGVSNTGDNLIVWQQKPNQLARTQIWFTRLDSAGAVEVDPMEAISSGLNDLTNLEATAHVSRADLHVVYMEGSDAQYAVLDDDGGVQDTRQVYSNLVGEAASPDVAVAPNGDVYVSYGVRDNPINDPWDLFAQVYWYDDDEWDGPEQVNDPDDPPAYFGRPAATNTGGAVFFGRDNNLQMVTLTKEAANQPPVAELSISPMDPKVDETVTFDGRDSTDPDDGDTVDEFNFEYGDGSSSGWVTTPTVTHSYSAAGTYTARLRVRDSQGLESTSADTISVTVTAGSTNRAPTAVLSVDNNAPDKGQEVTFSGTASFDTDGVISQYLFNFGDGENSGWVPSGTAKHTYNKEGVFSATLKVRDDDGAESALDTVQVSVVDTNEAPTANIVSIVPNPAMVGESVTFTGSGSDPDGTIADYSWESNLDGILGSTATLVLDTLTAGTHTISLKVRDDDGVWSEAATQDLVVKANSPFTIEDKTELPKQAYTDKIVEFRCLYTDVDNDPPTVTLLVYTKGSDWKTAEMRESDPTDTNYVDGKEYYFNKKFDQGDWKYHFEFRNSQHPERKTTDVTFNVKEPEGLIPGPGAGVILGAFLLAMVVVEVTRRGRKGQRI
jgi:PKD repeat protein